MDAGPICFYLGATGRPNRSRSAPQPTGSTVEPESQTKLSRAWRVPIKDARREWGPVTRAHLRMEFNEQPTSYHAGWQAASELAAAA